MLNRIAWTASVALIAAMAQASDAQTRQTTVITIERIQPGRWRATYSFPNPVTSLRFVRGAANHRERVWTIVTPGYRWGSADDRPLLQLDEGTRPESTLMLEFPEFTDPLPKEYELFQPFTDGAVALYTGHFYATPTGPTYGDSMPPLQTIRLIPPPGRHTVVRGRVTSGTVTFTDTIGDGTYIYVGTAQPIETPHLIAVVDPGMPDWLRHMFEQRLPELFAAYTTHFGASLPWKPVVLYSFHDTPASGYSSGGGTLTGFINMTLTGRDWRTSSPVALVQAFYLLAHESAHLWNGQLVESEGGPGSWMHEGSADALANEMLLAFGMIDRAEWRRRRENAINQCAAQVEKVSVHMAAQRGAFRAYYDCGFVLALWTEAAIRHHAPDANLFTFWSDLVGAALGNGRRYDERLYFGVMRDAGVPDSVTDGMRAFLKATSIDVAIHGLASLGLNIGPGQGTPPTGVQQTIARQAFAHVMGAACGRISFNWGNPIVTVALPECPAFSRALHVYAIENFRLADQAVELYDAVVARCAVGDTVRVQGQDGATLASFPCRQALEPRPMWYELRN